MARNPFFVGAAHPHGNARGCADLLDALGVGFGPAQHPSAAGGDLCTPLKTVWSTQEAASGDMQGRLCSRAPLGCLPT
jgi:hypothetical protein